MKKRSIYGTVLHKLGTSNPWFGKTLLDNALKARGLTPENCSAVDLFDILRNELSDSRTQSTAGRGVSSGESGVIFVSLDGKINHCDVYAQNLMAKISTNRDTIEKNFNERGIIAKAASLNGLKIMEIPIPETEQVLRVSLVPIMDENRRITGSISVLQDITFQSQIESEVVAHAEKLRKEIQIRLETEKKLSENQSILVTKAKLASLGEMASGMAHEINNPLAILSLTSEKMRTKLSESEIDKDKINAYLDKIEMTTERIAKIVKGLRTFAREGSDDIPIDTSLSSIIEDTLSFCGSRYSFYNIELKVMPFDCVLHIECRATQISQVLLNLINNAFDAVFTLPEKWVRIEVKDAGSFVEISVTDSGKGIPEDIRSKILQPFFTTKEVGKGTGLGLSISEGIIKAHHGTITIDATSANTRFVIRLPKKQPSTKSA